MSFNDDETRSVDELRRDLKLKLNILYQQLAITFGVKPKSGTLAYKFSRIKLPISQKIEGYDLDELSKKVEPLCDEDYLPTEQDIVFISNLIEKYKNYGRKSELEAQLQFLSGQSSNAIVDAENLNNIQNYLHVDRGQLETDFLHLLESLNSQQGKLILLVGNVGDGKSHLIGYMKEKYPNLFAQNNVKIHYDATESFDPQKTAIETLMDVLQPFSDSRISENSQNTIVAINMGVLVNFYRQVSRSGAFTQLVSFIENSGVINSNKITQQINSGNFELISFRNYPIFQLDEKGTLSDFYDELFGKIARQQIDNPFYQAYLDDIEHHVVRLTHRNFQLFCNLNVRETIKYLLIKIQIESKVIISTRALLELIHDIIVPVRTVGSGVTTFRDSLPYLLFGGSGDSYLVKEINKFDPQKFQNQGIEKFTTKIFNSNETLKQLVYESLSQENDESIDWIWDYIDDVLPLSDKVGLLLRIKYLFNHSDPIFNDDSYLGYLKLLTSVRKNEMDVIREFFKQVKEFIYKWNGSPKSNYIYTYIDAQNNFGVAVPLKIDFKGISEQNFDVVIILKNAATNEPNKLIIDYDLFELIHRVNDGYLLKKKDRHQFVNIATFIQKITKSDRASEETLIGRINDDKFYQLTFDGLGQVEMEEL